MAQTIYILSPPRSGRTVVWNIVKKAFPQKTVLLRKGAISFNDDDLYVIVLRHPFNTIMSTLNSGEMPINDSTLKKCTYIYLNSGGAFISSIDVKRENIILLFYEDFVDNLEHILTKMEADASNTEIVEEFRIENVIEKSKTMKKEDFITWLHDPRGLTSESKAAPLGNMKTMVENKTFVKNKVSKYKGKTNYKDLLTNEQIEKLNNNMVLKKIIDTFYK